MFEFQPNTSEYDFSNRPHRANQAFLLNQALGMFNQLRWDAFFERVKAAVLKRPRNLYDLETIPSSQVRARRYGGIQAVSLDRICGTLGRSRDFDNRFHPLNDRIRDRWVNIAVARHQNLVLEPVELIQVGDNYFVKDGHHRISVAHALGETVMDAEVTVWDVTGCLPWEANSAACRVPQTA
jgi:hypothetical protein